jgi:alkyldihydroxyacetonephosphate synthase
VLVGSEGTLGVLTAATLRVRPAPPARHYEAWMLPSFDAGTEALRALAQGGAAPDLARLSDREETRLTSALASSGGGGAAGKVEALGRRYLRLRGRAAGPRRPAPPRRP